MLDFVAIDFETANRHRHSMCQVGVTRVLDGVLDQTFSTLVRPLDDEHGFEQVCVDIHGIDAAAVVGAPEVVDVIDMVLDFVGPLPLVAHNAPFDAAVLDRAASRADVELPRLRFACTLALARRLVPGLASYRLAVLAEMAEIDLVAHDAGSDSAAAAALVLWLVRGSGSLVDDLDGLVVAARASWREIGTAPVPHA